MVYTMGRYCAIKTNESQIYTTAQINVKVSIPYWPKQVRSECIYYISSVQHVKRCKWTCDSESILVGFLVGNWEVRRKKKSQGQQKTWRVHRYICYLAYAYKAHQTLYLNCVCEDVSLCYVKLLKAVWNRMKFILS